MTTGEGWNIGLVVNQQLHMTSQLSSLLHQSTCQSHYISSPLMSKFARCLTSSTWGSESLVTCSWQLNHICLRTMTSDSMVLLLILDAWHSAANCPSTCLVRPKGLHHLPKTNMYSEAGNPLPLGTPIYSVHKGNKQNWGDIITLTGNESALLLVTQTKISLRLDKMAKWLNYYCFHLLKILLQFKKMCGNGSNPALSVYITLPCSLYCQLGTLLVQKKKDKMFEILLLAGLQCRFSVLKGPGNLSVGQTTSATGNTNLQGPKATTHDTIGLMGHGSNPLWQPLKG